MSMARAYQTEVAPARSRDDATARVQVKKARRLRKELRMLALCATLIMVFAGFFGLIYLKSQISSAQLEINDLKKQIQNAQSDTSRLQESVNSQVNIQRIMLGAKALGMGAPEKEQLIYVVPADANEATMSRGGQ